MEQTRGGVRGVDDTVPGPAFPERLDRQREVGADHARYRAELLSSAAARYRGHNEGGARTDEYNVQEGGL